MRPPLLKAVCVLLLAFGATWLLLALVDVWRRRGPWSEAFQAWVWAAALFALALTLVVSWRSAQKSRRRGEELEQPRR